MTPEEFQCQCEVAEGYLTLGMHVDAWNTPDQLPTKLKLTKSVLTLRMNILVKSGEFLKASYLAETLCQLDPDDFDQLISVARYRHQGGETELALTWLKSVEEKCDRDANFHHLRSQCLASLGHVEEAKDELAKAFSIDQGFKIKASEDPAFESIFGVDSAL